MSSVENLRKQAKLYVRWHRERRHTVAAIIWDVLPGFANLTDGEVLDHPFRLADAQALVARRAGYESWRALKQGQPRMTDESRADYPSQPILLNIEPTVFVTDFQRSLAFYVDQLGFKIGFTYGEPPFYGQVVRDAALLDLRLVHQPVVDRSRDPDLLSASIWVSHAKQLFVELQARGASFHQALRREPWHGQGQGGFIVRDPDGNLISFGGRTD
ncbi:VOC family protein [Phenylobacterium sp.]|uniref:VOC family protein n=1 Tax=Phenylobacterium sp. TaxID=1871053 RepID=UPI002608960D|nr:VOC family protein [Phenylobacterium sp.]